MNNKSLLFILATSLILAACSGNSNYQSSKSALNKKAAVHTAKKMLGIKYVYGGASPRQGFDCSGLVQYSYKKAGIHVPRTTGLQYKATKAISRKYLRAGDLVFFKIDLSRTVSHVGIYLGNNKFIHAPSSGKRVKISSMTNKYWRKKYIGAGRVY